jgi:hypothetical protein
LLNDKANDLHPKQDCLMTKQTIFIPNKIASWQNKLSSSQTPLLRDKARLICGKANCFCSKHDCSVTKQSVVVPDTIASWQSKLSSSQTRLLHDKAGLIHDKANCFCSKHDCFMTKQVCFVIKQIIGKRFSMGCGPPDKASPLRNWLIYELQPARFVSLLQEARLRSKSIAYETSVIVLYKTCQEQFHISNKLFHEPDNCKKCEFFCMSVSQTGL